MSLQNPLLHHDTFPEGLDTLPLPDGLRLATLEEIQTFIAGKNLGKWMSYVLNLFLAAGMPVIPESRVQCKKHSELINALNRPGPFQRSFCLQRISFSDAYYWAICRHDGLFWQIIRHNADEFGGEDDLCFRIADVLAENTLDGNSPLPPEVIAERINAEEGQSVTPDAVLGAICDVRDILSDLRLDVRGDKEFSLEKKMGRPLKKKIPIFCTDIIELQAAVDSCFRRVQEDPETLTIPQARELVRQLARIQTTDREVREMLRGYIGTIGRAIADADRDHLNLLENPAVAIIHSSDYNTPAHEDTNED